MPRLIVFACVLACLADGVASTALADAARAPHVEVGLASRYTDTRSDRLVPDPTVQEWPAQARLTLPLYEQIGARARIEGGLSAVDPDLAPGDAWRHDLRAGAELFLRDPLFGHIDAGYQFTRRSAGSARESEHAATLAVGVYTPDQGAGPLDWDLRVLYGSNSSHRLAAAPDWRLAASAAFGLYATDWLRIAGGVEWSRQRYVATRRSLDLRGRGALLFLLPSLGNTSITLELGGTGGRLRGLRDQAIYSSELAVTVHFPRAASLVSLVREQR